MLALASLVATMIVGATSSGADVVVLDLKSVGVDEQETRVLDGLLSEEIARQVGTWAADKRPKLATSDDLRTLLTLEANRAAAGCDDASCLAEVAQAFGARFVVTGSLGRLGSESILQLWLFDVEKSATVARSSATAADAAGLRPQLASVVTKVLAPIAPARTKVASSGSMMPTVLAISGGAVAGVAGLVAVGAGVGALVLDQRLAAGSGASEADKRQALGTGPALVVTTIVAGAAAVAGLVVLGVGLAITE